MVVGCIPYQPTFWEKNTGKIQVDLLKWGESGEQDNFISGKLESVSEESARKKNLLAYRRINMNEFLSKYFILFKLFR